MSQIAIQPFYLEASKLVIGTAGNQYEGHVSRAEATETSPVVWKGLTPTARFKKGAWQLQLDLAQDWATANSLANFLFDNDGTVQDYQLFPISDGAGFEGQLIVSPPGIGGQQGAVAVASVTLELTAKPTRIVDEG